MRSSYSRVLLYGKREYVSFSSDKFYNASGHAVCNLSFVKEEELGERDGTTRFWTNQRSGRSDY